MVKIPHFNKMFLLSDIKIHIFLVKEANIKLVNIGYKKKDDERHKDMHSLVGVFIRSDKEEQID